jgi:hypothetical protein
VQVSRKKTGGALVPFAIAVLVAVLSTVALFFLEFGTKEEVAGNGISMATSVAADKAGAIVLPTVDYNTVGRAR